MPFPNEHAARQTDPARYDTFRRVKEDWTPDGIDVIYGIKDGKTEIQAFRARRDKISPKEFKQWLDRNGFTSDKLEVATNEGKPMSEEKTLTTSDLLPGGLKQPEASSGPPKAYRAADNKNFRCATCKYYKAETPDAEKAHCSLFHFEAEANMMCDAWAGKRALKVRYKPGSPADDRHQRTPAPPKDRRRGSRVNRPGSAGSGSSGASIKVPASAEASLKTKVKEHNEKHGQSAGKRVTLGMLKKVWRRGAGAFSGSHRPGMTRAQWAMARVNHFLHLVRTGKPKDSKYVQDNDVLPKAHPKSSKKCATVVIVEANAKPFSNIPENKPNEKFDVPKDVKADAKLGLEMHKEFNRGGTEVGLTTARRLVRSSSVPYYGRHGVKHIANYFNRHEGDLKAEGAKPGDKGYPSAGLIAWKLWGGWPGKRWAQGIVERVENRKKPKKVVVRTVPPVEED